MPKYQILLFDADNTLFDFYRAEREALLDALQALEIPRAPDMVAVYSAINDGLWKKLERGEVTKDALRVQRFRDFFAYYGIDANAERMAKAYTDFLAQKGHLMPEALEVCGELAGHCDMYIITNGISTVQRSRFEGSPLRKFFKDLFISEELGFEKPRREYFDAVAAAVPDYKSKNALVIGDSLSSDMQGGANAGLDICWYNPGAKPAPDHLKITYTVKNLGEVIPLVLGK